MGITRGECSRENRRQRRDRAVHQAREPWLDDLQNEKFAIGGFFLAARSFVEFFGQVLGAVFMAALFLGKVVEQLPDTGILGAAG